jgi:hypothetical protein
LSQSFRLILSSDSTKKESIQNWGYFLTNIISIP